MRASLNANAGKKALVAIDFQISTITIAGSLEEERSVRCIVRQHNLNLEFCHERCTWGSVVAVVVCTAVGATLSILRHAMISNEE